MAYRQHGGSGYSFGLEEVLSLPLGTRPGELLWWVERLRAHREAEAEAIKKASRGE